MRCRKRGLTEHTARDCGGWAKARSKGDGGKGYNKGKGKAGNGKKDSGKFGSYKGGAPGESKTRRYQGQCCRLDIDGESLA